VGLIVGTPHIKGAGYFINDKNLRTRQSEPWGAKNLLSLPSLLLMQQWKDGAWCGKCMKPICDACGKRAAVHWVRAIPEKDRQYAEAQMRSRSSIRMRVGPRPHRLSSPRR